VLRYLYRWVLKRGDVARDIRGPRRVRHLPVVLSLDEVRRFLAAIVSHKHRMVLTTVYSAGLRVSEVVNLHVADVDAARMVIRTRAKAITRP
jgi:integrase/recombinase XerD